MTHPGFSTVRPQSIASPSTARHTNELKNSTTELLKIELRGISAEVHVAVAASRPGCSPVVAAARATDTR